MNRQRSQHSLIVESVARILDDTALDERGDREKQRMAMYNEVNFKTGPPSEVHNFMCDDHAIQMNSLIQNELEKKWNNHFEGKSSNSLNTPGGGFGGMKFNQKKQ